MRRASIRLEGLAYLVGLACLAWALITFILLPLVTSLEIALFRDGRFAVPQIVGDLAASRRVRAAVWNTVWMTALTTITVTVLGVFQVLALEYFALRGRRILEIGFSVPLVFGSVVGVAGFNFTYGPHGAATALGVWAFGDAFPTTWFSGWAGVLFTHTFLMTSFHILFLRAAMRRIDYSTIEAARSLGASEWRIISRVVLPAILPVLLAVTVLTLHTALGSFAAPQILGGRDFFMLSQVILTLSSLRRQDMAAVLALALGVIVMILIVLSQRLEERGSFHGGSKTPVPIALLKVRHPLANAALHAVTWLLWGICVAPVLLVVLFSFAPSSSIGVDVVPTAFTLDNYVRAFAGEAAGSPFSNSVVMSLFAVGIALAAGLFVVPILLRSRTWFTRGLDVSLALPWVLPSVLLAVGLIAAFDRPNPLVAGAVLVGSFWLLPCAYTIVVVPMTVRFLRAAFAGIDPAYEDAARSLGASHLYRFRRVILPLVAPTAILVAAMGFNQLMTEYPLSAFLYNVNNKPLPIAIVDGAVSADAEQKALNLVYATLIMGFSLVVILAAKRVGLGRGPKTNTL